MVIIDTDGGVDDALAVALAVRLLADEQIVICAVHGNVGVAQAATNIATILERLGSKLTVLVGAAASADGFAADATYVHGVDGMGGAIGQARLASDFVRLEDWLAANAASVTTGVRILGIGPATNIPTIVAALGADNVTEIILMTGALFDRGNITPFAEFNAYGDPVSLKEVLSLGVAARLVPLDLCRKIQLYPSDLPRFSIFGGAADILTVAHRHYMHEYLKWEGLDGCFPHDSLALLALLRPGWFQSYALSFDIDLTGPTRGQLRFDPHGPLTARFCLGGDLKRVRDFFANGFQLGPVDD